MPKVGGVMPCLIALKSFQTPGSSLPSRHSATPEAFDIFTARS